jgi:hypothetical protein
MKTFFTNPGRFLGLATAALLAAAPAAQAVTQPPNPTNQWDCVMSGNGQNGIIFLNITDDIDTTSGLPTFEALFVQAGHTKFQTGRSSSTGTGRDGSSGGSSFTNLYGGGFVFGSAGPVANNGTGDDWLADSRGHRGNWFFNSKKQLVGSFYTVLNANNRVTNYFQTCVDEPLSIPLTNNGSFNIEVSFCFTNPVFVTNYPWHAPDDEVGFTNLTFTNANFTIGSSGLTNNVSFVGKVVPGKRITLVGTSAFGRFTITGVPLRPIPTALPGNGVDGFFWTGTKNENGFTTIEQFALFDTPIQNAYLVSGQGPSYTYGSGSDLGSELCLISSKKKIAFSIAEFAVGTLPGTVVTVNLRGTCGQFINTKRAIGAKGQGSSTADSNIIKFDANLSPFNLP